MGLGGLRLSPDTFWALSPREFLVLTGGGADVERPLRRAEFDALLARYPD